MKLTIEGKEYDLPASLAYVTLQQRIDYEQQHGKALREQLKKTIDMKAGPLQEMEFTDYHYQLACRSLSFFAGIPLDIVHNTAIDEVLAVYHGTMKSYADDQNFQDKEFELNNEFSWNGDTWTIAPPELKPDSKMTFGEFITSKQIVQNMVDLGDEKWGALLPLCCIFFRKKEEAFNEEFSTEGSERYELMKSLPLQYALHVAFFLNVCQISWLNTSQYSGKAGDLVADDGS
jgi:hypothetical protein